MIKKIEEMDQGTFNVWCSIIFTVVVLIPGFLFGFHRWAELYLR